ncbi:hypothetical protein WN944_022211 [Citrus x changshan-huyou]|uniref:Uncharacterized protein n=1 Tax=Citrus x changshan-huyou TaxID=2935761 RepID=A0AAP0N177_9ROSI
MQNRDLFLFTADEWQNKWGRGWELKWIGYHAHALRVSNPGIANWEANASTRFRRSTISLLFWRPSWNPFCSLLSFTALILEGVGKNMGIRMPQM